MRSWFISAVALVAVSVACGGGAGNGGTESPLGVSVNVGRAADKLHRYIVEDEHRPTTVDDLKSFTSQTRDRIAALRKLVKTDADRNVLRLVALIGVKESERLGLVLISTLGGAVDGQKIKTLYETRLVCDGELRGWVGTVEADLAELEEGACLAEAREVVREPDQ